MHVDKTDLSLTLATLGALTALVGPIAAVIVAAFVLGLLVGQSSPRH